MSGVHNISRRDFLKHTGATGALVLGAHVVPGSMVAAVQAQAAGRSVQPNLFVGVADDGTVTITCSRSEMGQGVRTGIPMILADEMEADWQRVKIWQAPGDETKYDPAGKDGQNTDGSRSTPPPPRRHARARGGRPLRAGAGGGPEVGRRCERGVREGPPALSHTGSGRSFDFGEVVDAAADITVAHRRRCAEAQAHVAVEVHRPRHAGDRQLRHEHRRRQLRGRRHHPRHEDRRGGTLAGLSRQGEVVRGHRGAQDPGRRAGGGDPRASRRQAGGVPGPRRRGGGRDQHMVGA